MYKKSYSSSGVGVLGLFRPFQTGYADNLLAKRTVMRETIGAAGMALLLLAGDAIAAPAVTPPAG